MATTVVTTTSEPSTSDANSVTYIRNELREVLPDYSLIDDCLAGQRAIKSQNITYLPKPGIFAQAEESIYAAYLQRAVFYGVAKRTLDGMVGEVFAHSPVVEVPSALKLMIDDVTGAGMPLDQLAKKAVRYVVAYCIRRSSLRQISKS